MTATAGVVLAAGMGTRLRPLTSLRPKPLCPIGTRPSLDLALDALAHELGDSPHTLAVNAFHLAEQLVRHLQGRVTVSLEDELLGTGGGLARLAGWRAGRNTLLVNGDAYLTTADPTTTTLGALLAGWDGHTVRMLGVPGPPPGDFPQLPGWRYVGVCLMPGDLLDGLPSGHSGLYKQIWQPAAAGGRLEFVEHHGVAIDTGTPAGYLAANLHASGGLPVLGVGAQVHGRVTRSVVWDGAVVAPGEHLIDSVRAGNRDHPVTLYCGPT